jgi:hypothetical protein
MRITERRAVIVRELSRLAIRHALGIDQDQGHLSDPAQVGERASVLSELSRAAAFGTMVAMQRYRFATIASHAVSGSAA